MLKLRITAITVICVLLLASCSVARENANEVSRTVFAMDTVMDLKAYGKNAETAVSEAEREIKRLDAMLSRGSVGSEIYKLNQEKTAEVSQETADIISEALEVSSSTDGAFDITIAPVMDLWGFFTKDFRVPAAEELAAALERVDYHNVSVEGRTVTVDGNSQIDLGGIAKGYLSGRIMEIFRGCGVESGIVSLGGNVQTLGTKPDGSKWRVAIQNPDGGGFIGVIAAEDKAVITSGGYQRFFEQDGKAYHHIIDPKTGMSAGSGLKSVTVVSDNAALADGLSTSLYIMGLEKSKAYWRTHDGFEVIFMTDDNRIYVTKGLQDIWSSDFDYEVAE